MIDRSKHEFEGTDVAESKRRKWGWKRWTLIGVVAAVVLFVGGPFVYIHFIQGPAPAEA